VIGKDRLDGRLCTSMRSVYDIAAITNDIYTSGMRISGALGSADTGSHRAETGGCPHNCDNREDLRLNLAAVADKCARNSLPSTVLIESGCDNLAATFPLA